MSKTEFHLRTDARSRLETELLLPLALVWSTAVLVLFANSGAVPSSMPVRHLEIPWWLAAIAGLLLLTVVGLRLHLPRRYDITDQNIDVITPLVKYQVSLKDIVEVESMSERAPDSILAAVLQTVPARVLQGFNALGLFLSGKRSVEARGGEDYCTSDTGGVQVSLKDGKKIMFTPNELATFLSELEFEFRRQNIPASVIRSRSIRLEL